LFRRLAVFAGGFTLEAAEDVVAGGTIERDDVQDLVTQLVEKSLVVLDVEHDRYRMLETVRQYALEHLDAGEDGNEVRTRHLDFYLALCEAAVPELRGALAGAWLERLDGDRENILAAHRWCDKARDGGPWVFAWCVRRDRTSTVAGRSISHTRRRSRPWAGTAHAQGTSRDAARYPTPASSR
jgi:hypothetical protein